MSNARSLVTRRLSVLPAPNPAPDGGASSPLDETRRTLAASARRRFGATPAELVVDHLLATTETTDFAVCEAALDALVRRMSFAVRDGLAVVAKPPRGALFGSYATRAGRSERPYVTQLDSVRPIQGSCDCPDFVRSSLGLCKHLLVVLDAVHRAGAVTATKVARAPRATLSWDPALPLQGALDRAAGLRFEGELPASLARVLPLRAAALRDVRKRAALLERLHGELHAPRSAFVTTPAARRVVDEELERARSRAAFAARAPRAIRELGSLGRKLYPYQREGVVRLLETGRLLLADDMGLGKTTQAIAACHALFRAKVARKGLVIAPSSLKPQWLREWQETTNTPIFLVEGNPEERRRIYREHKAGFLVVGYEQLLRDLTEIQALAPSVVVVDEAQRIKNYATKTAAYVKALDPEYRFVLSGTPMENRLEELASILDWVDDVALSPKWRLVPWHTMTSGSGRRGADDAGARNLDTLRARIGTCTLRRLRRDVIGQLPSRTDTRVPIEMTAQQREAHDELSLPIAVLARKAAVRPLTQPEFLRLMSLLTQQRIVSNGLAQQRFDEIWPTCSRSTPDAALLEGLFAPKLLELRRLIVDLALDQERKVVVFSQWRRMLRLAEWSVRDLLQAQGCRAVFFTGAESTAQRTRSVVDFHDDPNARVMFLSDAGGVGLNLQRAASACINLELPWNPAVVEQRVGRIHRLGQDKPIDVYNLVSEYGIESRISLLLGTKQALFAGVFDGTTDEVRFDAAGSFAARIEKLVDPDVRAEPAASIESEDEGEGSAGSAAAPADGSSEAAPAVMPTVMPAAAELLAGVRVERTAGGGLRIDAPPAAAQWMMTAFEAMATLLRAPPSGT